MTKKCLFIRLASYMGEKSSHPENVMTPIDIGIMCSIAKEMSCDISLIDTEAVPISYEDLIKKIADVNPDIIVLKAKSPSTPIIKRLSLDIDVPIIGFGQAFSSSPEAVLEKDSSILCAIIGEPELTFKEILISLKKEESISTILGIAFYDVDRVSRTEERPLLENLDLLPSPMYDLFLSNKYYSFYPTRLFVKKKMAFMLASRGCPFNCIYCSPTLRNSYGKSMRHHSIERVVSEMKYLESKGITIIQMRDDCFTYDRIWVEQLCDKIIQSGLKVHWMIQTHINHVDEGLLTKMRKANCMAIGFGIESASQKVLNTVKKFNKLEHAVKMFDYCKKIGIKTIGFFLIGSPGETKEETDLTKKLMKRLCPDLIQVAFFTFYPGSDAYQNYLSDVDREAASTAHHYNGIEINLSRISSEELRKIQRDFYLSYILMPRVFMRLCIETIVNIFFNPKITFQLVFKGTQFLSKKLMG